MGKLSMKDMLALFRRDAEYDTRHVDDGADHTIFSRTRVLESPTKGGSAGGMMDYGESTERNNGKRKAGSLGLKKTEHSVWGRR